MTTCTIVIYFFEKNCFVKNGRMNGRMELKIRVYVHVVEVEKVVLKVEENGKEEDVRLLPKIEECEVVG